MTETAIIKHISDSFPGVDIVVAGPGTEAPEIAWGDTFFIYDPQRNLSAAQRFPFATIVTKDYTGFDEASNLDRQGVFRLNIGVSRETFQSLFGPKPDAKSAGDGKIRDFTALDELLPHPVYAAQNFICVLNPSKATFERLRPFLLEAYEIAVHRVANRGTPAAEP